MLAIQTKFIGASNFRSARIKAAVTEPRSSSFGKQRALTVNWDDRLNPEQNHIAAARALIVKLDWQTDREWYFGSTERGYVLVCANEYARVTFDDDRRAELLDRHARIADRCK